MKAQIIKSLFKRIISSIVVLFLLVTFVFILTRISPGDPTQKFISPNFNPKLSEKVKESFKLDKPVSEQYLSFIENAAEGNLGVSYNYRMPVVSVIFDYLPFTLIFSGLSFIIQILLGFYLAIYSVKKINGKLDKFLNKSSIAVYATPAFVLGVFLIYLFSLKLNLFPSSGLSSIDSSDLNFFGKLGDYLKHLVLPLITLSLGGIAIYYKYLRDNLEDVYNKQFILNLRSYGIDEKEILRKHIIPNAINPVISVAGVELGILLSGALITEVIFGLPGMGRLTVEAILSRDYPLVVGCTLTAGILMIITNFIADLVRIKIDKRHLKEAIS